MTGYVYAMERYDGLIKIGWSRQPFECLTQISKADGMHSMLGFAKGARDHETATHSVLAQHRSHREWYFPHKHVLAFVGLLPLKCPEQVTASNDEYDDFISEVDSFIASSGTTASALGTIVFNDPCFVFDLRKGRKVSLVNVNRLLDYMRDNQ